jgi:hypothetical protein
MENNILLNDDGDGGDNDIFIYTGGGQQVPRDVRRAKIDESVDTIAEWAFMDCTQLIEVKGHSKLKKIEVRAFHKCRSLIRLIHMNGVKEIEEHAFQFCGALSDVDFDKLEIIGDLAFSGCESLRSINMPSIRRVGTGAFWWCTKLTEAVFSENLQRIDRGAFHKCTSLRRIAIPLKDNFLNVEGDIGVFSECNHLSRVDIVGGIHKTISSLHMESWRDEMAEEIDQINQTLPITPAFRGVKSLYMAIHQRTVTIQRWIESVLDRMEHYKTEHQILLKEAMALLELALWKAKLEENRSSIDTESVALVRKEHRVTCGAGIVIKNVLPYLVLK